MLRQEHQAGGIFVPRFAGARNQETRKSRDRICSNTLTVIDQALFTTWISARSQIRCANNSSIHCCWFGQKKICRIMVKIFLSHSFLA